MSRGVANSDYVPDPFPGISSGASSTGAAGSSAPRTAPPAAAVPPGDSGIPGVGTPAPLSGQAAEGHTTSTQQPGQTASSAISPGPEDEYADTGAGHGGADHWKRYAWQQEAG